MYIDKYICIYLYRYICIYIHIYMFIYIYVYTCSVGLGCRIHQLHLCRGISTTTTPNRRPGYNTKQSGGEVPVKLELCRMLSNPPLPSLPGPLWPGMVAPDRALSMG